MMRLRLSTIESLSLSTFNYLRWSWELIHQVVKRSNNSFEERRSGIDFYRKPVPNFRCFYQSTLLATNIASQLGVTQKLMFFILGRCNFSETILRNPISNLEYLHKVSLFLCNKTPVKSEKNKQFSFSDYKERKKKKSFYMKGHLIMK